jgi:hypothetical protein
MFKKLLVAVLALLLILSWCSIATAAKSPNETKKLIQALPEGAWRGNTTVFPTDIRPVINPYTGTNTESALPAGLSLTRGSSACSWLYFDCNLTYFIGPPFYGAAVRFSAGGDICSLKTIEIPIYNPGSAYPDLGGITAYVWADDGFGFPGAVIYSVGVPHASVVFFPSVNSIDISAANIIINGGDYHIGYIPNSVNDTYAGLTDDGTCGVARSTFWDGLGWFPNAIVFGADLNWVIAVEACCFTPVPGVCSSVEYNCGPAFRWAGGVPWALRVSTGAEECTLTSVQLRISIGGQVGTGGIDVHVWADAGGLPGADLVAPVHVVHGDILYSPSYTVVDVPDVVFPPGTDFHIGYEVTNPVTDDYQPISDDGTCGQMRSSLFDEGASDLWYLMATLFAPDDYNWLFRADLCCAAPPAPTCFNLSYWVNAWYFWTIPDAYGDDFFNQRFSNPDLCTLKVLNFQFYGPGGVGAPGVLAYVWNSDGLFPTTVINTFPLNPVVDYFPTPTSIDVSASNIVLSTDYHVGYTPIFNGVGDVLAVISDDGSNPLQRSSEFYLGFFSLMITDWGVDVNFAIDVDICCVPPGYCAMTCSPTDEWPMFAHDPARTSQSELTLGDLCGVINAWVYTGTSPARLINFTTPVIADDRVFVAHDDRMVAVDLGTGVTLWDTEATPALIPQWALALNTTLRAMPTVEGDYIYFGTGSLRGFAKAVAATGDTVWTRGLATGAPLPGTPGTTRYSPSIIMGNEIYFGDDNGQIYALDKTTGGNLYFGQLFGNPPTNTTIASVYTSPSTDGSQLFFGTGIGFTTGGAVFGVSPGGAFTVNWFYVSINASGFVAGPSFRCDNLFINSYASADLAPGLRGYRQNLDPATGVPQWGDNFAMGQAWSSPVATTNNLAYFANMCNGCTGSVNSRAVRAVSFLNSTVWINPGTAATFDNNLFTHASVTCDPYVVYGTADQSVGDGRWRIADGTTGAILINYVFSGFVMGTAIAQHSDGTNWLVPAIRSSVYAPNAGSGKLYGFKIGPPRPRLDIPELIVNFPGTNTSDPPFVQRTDPDAVRNTGCVSLNVTATLEAGFPPTARRVTDVNPALARTASELANSMIDVRVEDMLASASRSNRGKFLENSFELDEFGEVAMLAVQSNVKPAEATSSRLIPPSWVSWINPPSGGASVAFAVAPSAGQAFTFEFDRSGMNLLADNFYYVEIVSDDPDYNVEDPLAVPQGVIEYHIPYEYCPVATDVIAFGNTGEEWVSNRAEFGDGVVTFDFTLTGADDPLYEGGAWFMTSMDDAAWNTYPSYVGTDYGYLYPFYVGPYVNGDCGGCDFGVTLPVEYTIDGGVSYNFTTGDLCSLSVIDSLQGTVNPHQAGPSIGLNVQWREVGTYGADFGDFKLVVVDVINRNAGAITGLYCGNIEDWDVLAYQTNDGGGDADKGYIYLYDNTDDDYYGNIGIPQKGSYWPDGTKTDPMYNGRILHNPDDIYTSASLDSLFMWTDGRPEGELYFSPEITTPATKDKTYTVAWTKTDLPGFGTKKYGYAFYGIQNTASINADTEALAAFINKYAGFARGDVNDDDQINLLDVVRLSRYVASLGPGPEPFKHLGDVDNDGDVDGDDCAYLAAYYFTGGPPPQSDFMF